MVGYLARKRQAGIANPTPSSINSAGKKALYNALEGDSELVLQIHDPIIQSKPAGWKTNMIKQKRVKQAILAVVGSDKVWMQYIYDVVFAQYEYAS